MTMRLRVAFKLHGEEADLARQIADMAGVPADKIAKLAMQRYMSDLLDRAQAAMKESGGSVDSTPDQVSPPVQQEVSVP